MATINPPLYIFATYRDDEMSVAEHQRNGYPTLLWDVQRDRRSIVLGFGTGHFLELRAVGNTTGAIDQFQKIFLAGGLIQESAPNRNTTLYQAGDTIFGGFVFIDPIPRPELIQGHLSYL